jgi:hypothetical protein
MAQGYGVTQNLLLQYNQSSILLERNGKASSGQRTRHINIQYFFITDRVNSLSPMDAHERPLNNELHW